MSGQGFQHQLPFQNEVGSLKPLCPHSQHPRRGRCGCGTAPGCDAVFPASMATCRWALRMQTMLPCTAAAVSILEFHLWPGSGLYWSWLAQITLCWSLSMLCASWSSPGHAWLLPPMYPQVGGCSCCCSQPVSMVSFHANVSSRNVDWQLTPTGALSSWWIEHIRGQLNRPNLKKYIFFQLLNVS